MKLIPGLTRDALKPMHISRFRTRRPMLTALFTLALAATGIAIAPVGSASAAISTVSISATRADGSPVLPSIPVKG